mmetsp:Transcript_28435/g.87985  ORF Transcript_28435/g.87985 Transcript_28435/m.87985 type:complete len:219 (+) Transcript_28435:353-1009(+)
MDSSGGAGPRGRLTGDDPGFSMCCRARFFSPNTFFAAFCASCAAASAWSAAATRGSSAASSARTTVAARSPPRFPVRFFSTAPRMASAFFSKSSARTSNFLVVETNAKRSKTKRSDALAAAESAAPSATPVASSAWRAVNKNRSSKRANGRSKSACATAAPPASTGKDSNGPPRMPGSVTRASSAWRFATTSCRPSWPRAMPLIHRISSGLPSAAPGA